MVMAEGPDAARALAAAAACFPQILPTLVGELALLRRPVAAADPLPEGPVARRMSAACRPHLPLFLTPMAAVAGAVADEVLAVMRRAAPDLSRAHVNNGGDIALHLAPGRSFEVGVVADLALGRPSGAIRVTAAMPVRGIATSGWPGRSFSLGIADAVTVLAPTAAAADAAATVIANAVDCDHPGITRVPASALDPDSDLGDRLVVRGVPPLADTALAKALAAGADVAEKLVGRGLALGAVLFAQGRFRVVDGSAGVLSISGREGDAHGPRHPQILDDRRGDPPRGRATGGDAAAPRGRAGGVAQSLRWSPRTRHPADDGGPESPRAGDGTAVVGSARRRPEGDPGLRQGRDRRRGG
jgi:ApbE superfamily uncharacterized protein (UPF0280 family)